MRLRPLIATLAALATSPVAVPAWAVDPVPMAAHKATYDLTLDNSRGDVTNATGQMNYEVTDACDGWATRQRLTMTITNRDGQDIELVSDYLTWESKDGLSMRFRTRQTTDTAVTEQVEGTATLDSNGGAGSVHYTVPEDKNVALPAGTLFSMAHTEAIIAAAQAGKKFLSVPIFDGTGSKGAQDSFIVIGAWGPTTAAPFPALAKLESGKMHISFFDRDAKATNDKPSGSPDYEVGMTYYSNGVANDLMMNFSDFTMRGNFSSFAESPPLLNDGPAIVTGATGGVGYTTAEGLARAGRRVVLTGRSVEKGWAAIERLRKAVPSAQAEFMLLDVSSLGAVEQFVSAWFGPVGLLINNAGVMAIPERRLSPDGFELQLATNYLGHFALTLRLLPALLAAPGARIVDVSSLAHRGARIAFEDLQSERSYSPYGAYGQTKLAMLLFARELQRRARERGWDLMSIAAHPGWSATSIVSNGLGPSLKAQLASVLFRLAGQSPADGAKPILYAALDPAANPDLYYGPANLGETRGPVAPARMMPQATDAAVAAKLFDRSEQLTGVTLESVVKPA